MKKNIGTVDRVVRTLVAVIIAVLFFTNVISGTLGIILLILAGVFVVTSFLCLCPLYMLFGFNTMKKAAK